MIARWISSERRTPKPAPAVTCSGLVAAHDAVDPRPILIGPNRLRVTACRGCRAVIATLVSVTPDRRLA